MKISYFPGCSLHSMSAEYDLSFKAVCHELGIELKEPHKWICCGTTPAHSTSRLLGAAMPVKNLTLIEQEGFDRVVVPCAACYSRFKSASHEIAHDKALAQEVEEVLGERYGRTVESLHPLQLFREPEWQEKIKNAVRKKLQGLKVACYYGCLITRPPKVMQFDQAEYPMSMDLLLRDLGIETIDWAYKVDCCGASLSISKSEIMLEMSRRLLEDAQARGANAIAVGCSLCHVNLDTRQGQMEKAFGLKLGIPVVYFTQLMGLAFGLRPDDLGFKKHMVDAAPVIAAAA
jgi:heterodisulfide reductase subunit B